MEVLRFLVHYSLHFLVPGLLAYLFFRQRWKQVWLIFLASMLVDLDHLLASPVFDPGRCSIGFHPLHSYFAITVYFAGLFFRKTRILAMALLLHMFADWQDCHLW